MPSIRALSLASRNADRQELLRYPQGTLTVHEPNIRLLILEPWWNPRVQRSTNIYGLSSSLIKKIETLYVQNNLAAFLVSGRVLDKLGEDTADTFTLAVAQQIANKIAMNGKVPQGLKSNVPEYVDDIGANDSPRWHTDPFNLSIFRYKRHSSPPSPWGGLKYISNQYVSGTYPNAALVSGGEQHVKYFPLSRQYDIFVVGPASQKMHHAGARSPSGEKLSDRQGTVIHFGNQKQRERAIQMPINFD